MLINCPKCGFSQPKDRYCANCGVDMENYRPKSEPILKKILGNPFLHVAIVFILVFSAILFIQQKRREELRSRVAYLKSGPVVVEHEEKPEVKIVPPTMPPAETATARQNPPPTMAPKAAAAVATRPEAATTEKNPAVTKVTIYFLEVDSAVVASWLQDSRVNSQYRNFDGVSMGPISAVAQKLKNPRVRVLQTIERKIDTTTPEVDFFVGTHHSADPDAELGLAGSIVLGETKDNMLHGEVAVQRSFRDPRDPTKPLERTSFGSGFEMLPTDGYMMVGVTPRRLYDFPDDWNPDAFLTIFKSRPFLSGQTEFTLMVEFANH
jgi:hypothetical protein